MSTPGPICWPWRSSGAAWARVAVVLMVAVALLATAAIPKSDSFGLPYWSIRMLSGLMSRWSTPESCAAWVAPATAAIISTASGQGSGPPDRSRAPSEPPVASCMTM